MYTFPPLKFLSYLLQCIFPPRLTLTFCCFKPKSSWNCIGVWQLLKFGKFHGVYNPEEHYQLYFLSSNLFPIPPQIEVISHDLLPHSYWVFGYLDFAGLVLAVTCTSSL